VCGWMLSTQQYRCHHSVDTRYPYHPLNISFVHQMMAVSPCNVTALVEASGETSRKHRAVSLSIDLHKLEILKIKTHE